MIIYEINTKEPELLVELMSYINSTYNTTSEIYTGPINWNGHGDISDQVTFISTPDNVTINLVEFVKSTGFMFIRKLKGNDYVEVIQEPLEDIRNHSLARINQSASDQILALYPLWKQSNMMARSIELQSIGQPNWTADETTEWNNLTAAWDHIKQIRSQSNTAYQLVSVATTEQEINTTEITFTGGNPL